MAGGGCSASSTSTCAKSPVRRPAGGGQLAGWPYGGAMSTLPPDPEEATAAGAPARAEIPAATRVGAVHLTVADLTRSLDYYERTIGLRVHERGGERATLGGGGED